MILRAALLTLPLLLAGGASAACPLTEADGTVLQADDHALAFQTEPQPVVGQPFAVVVKVCRNAGGPFTGDLVVDAGMPAHKHGMNYRPKVKALDDGRFRAEGYLFHMPGQWRFVFELRGDGPVRRLEADYRLQ